MKSTNDNLRNAKRRDDAVNPNLDKMQKYSRNMSVIPMTAMLQNTPDWKIKQALTKIKSPIDYMSGQVDITKSYGEIFNPHGQRDTVVAPVAQLLLDLFPDAAAAYSLRKLRNSYSGSAIRVRRSSDNTEQDIGFVNNELDTVSLLSFVGSNTGFVIEWYDQSGNNNDSINTTVSTQPKIVDSGSVIMQGSKPAIHFDNDWMMNNSKASSSTSTMFLAHKGTSTNKNIAVVGLKANNGDAQVGVFYWDNQCIGLNAWNGDSWGFDITNAQFNSPTLITVLIKEGNITTNGSKYFANSNEKSLTQKRGSTNLNTVISDGLFIGRGPTLGTETGDGLYQELVIYDDDYSIQNRSGIETNINNHYSIY